MRRGRGEGPLLGHLLSGHVSPAVVGRPFRWWSFSSDVPSFVES